MRVQKIIAGLAVLALIALIVNLPVGEGKYFGRDMGSPSCGDAYSCHGPEDPDFKAVISGPSEMAANEVVEYTITILDGPGLTYGFYALVQTEDGKFQDISGNPLVSLTSDHLANFTHDTPFTNNKITFEMKAPRYAGEFVLVVAVNSADGDSTANKLNDSLTNVETVSEDGLNWTKGDDTGPTDGQTLSFSDEWTMIKMHFKVHFPEESFDPYIYWFGCGVSMFVILLLVVFIATKARK